MKKLLILSLLGLSACNAGHDFNKVTLGMQSSQIIELVGEPETKSPILTGEWWIYNRDNKLIVLNNDTVVTIKYDLKASQDSMKAAGVEMKQLLDSFSK